jgi:hypothetical protein
MAEMRKNSYTLNLTASQTLAYILRCISEGKNENQIVDRFNGDTELVETWVDALKRIHFLVKNYFDELIVTPDGADHLQKFNSYR